MTPKFTVKIVKNWNYSLIKYVNKLYFKGSYLICFPTDERTTVTTTICLHIRLYDVSECEFGQLSVHILTHSDLKTGHISHMRSECEPRLEFWSIVKRLKFIIKTKVKCRAQYKELKHLIYHLRKAKIWSFTCYFCCFWQFFHPARFAYTRTTCV